MPIVDDKITIPDSDLKFDFIRASGPGGQNVNKVSTAVQLRFNVDKAAYWSEEQRERLKKMAGKKMTTSGFLVITARRFRSQEKNRMDAVDRLIKLVRRAIEQPKPRLKKKPSKAAKEVRLREKKKISEKKKMRQGVSSTEE